MGESTFQSSGTPTISRRARELTNATDLLDTEWQRAVEILDVLGGGADLAEPQNQL
jgi:hypothetical protein